MTARRADWLREREAAAETGREFAAIQRLITEEREAARAPCTTTARLECQSPEVLELQFSDERRGPDFYRAKFTREQALLLSGALLEWFATGHIEERRLEQLK